MQDRHTLVNFYLLLGGFVIAGVATVLDKQPQIPVLVGTVLLWLLCGIGWVDFLSIIRLRQAWHDSAQTMNQIKYFYIQRDKEFAPDVLHRAFRWKQKTLPVPGKFWTVYFYSAMLIALLDSVAFVAGGLLMNWEGTKATPARALWPWAVLGLVLFGAHVLLYHLFLRKPPSKTSDSTTQNKMEAPYMQNNPRPSDPGNQWVDIQQEDVKYTLGNLFRIVEASLRYRRFDGQMSKSITRANFERGDAVGVLLYNPQQDAVILVRQFRYPVYAGLSDEQRQGAGAQQAWILEIAAGIAEPGETAPRVGRRELLEEAGYAVHGNLNFVATIYPSPGGSSERIHVYWGEVSATGRTHAGGGLENEGEDTQVVTLPFQEAMDMIARGEIKDAKTILALQHLALAKAHGSDTGTV